MLVGVQYLSGFFCAYLLNRTCIQPNSRWYLHLQIFVWCPSHDLRLAVRGVDVHRLRVRLAPEKLKQMHICASHLRRITMRRSRYAPQRLHLEAYRARCLVLPLAHLNTNAATRRFVKAH